MLPSHLYMAVGEAKEPTHLVGGHPVEGVIGEVVPQLVRSIVGEVEVACFRVPIKPHGVPNPGGL